MDRPVRYLLGWCDESDAIVSLLGHVPAPGEDVASQRKTWEAFRRTLQDRPAYNLPTPVLEELPPQFLDRASAFRARSDVTAAMARHDGWILGMADLNEVLSFQKLVMEEDAVERVRNVSADDLEGLYSLCLPDAGEGVDLSGMLDHSRKAVTFSSMNPNLRVGSHMVTDIDVPITPGGPARKEKFIGYSINFGARFVQVAEYNGRWFVRDGYHRTYGLLRRGIHRVPCVFFKARSFQELGPTAPGFFSYEVLFGDRPPFLKDFLDDSVSASVVQQARRKVVRISAEEFDVEV